MKRVLLIFSIIGLVSVSCASNIEKPEEITNIPVSSISLSRSSIELVEGESITLTATVSPNNATDKRVSWSSNNSSIAEVDQNGSIIVKKVGTAKITASAGGKSASCKVTVIAKTVAVSKVSLDKTSLSLRLGEEIQLNVTIEPSNASAQNVSWETSSSAVATVNNGLVKGIAIGTAIITASCGGKTATCNVTIKAIEIESITLSESSIVLPIGDCRHLSASIKPDNAANQDLVWDSSNKNIATVENGLIKGISEGIVAITVSAKGGEASAKCDVRVIPSTPDIQTPLCLTAFRETRITITNPRAKTRPIEYSLDKTTWKSCNETKVSIGLLENESVYLRGDGSLYSELAYGGDSVIYWDKLGNDCLHIDCDYCYVWGNVISLMYRDSFSTTTELPEKCTCQRLFCGSKIKKHPEKKLILPLTKLTRSCYAQMFHSCTTLNYPPELPAISLSEECYAGMFYNCSGLLTAPNLPATQATPYCYSHMFAECISLVASPELPATAVGRYCYKGMFKGCIKLKQTPRLPALSVKEKSYSEMFKNCTSLKQAPDLPATTLDKLCYERMFENCASMMVAPELPALTLKDDCYYYMFHNCSALEIAPALPATELDYGCYWGMFYNCTSLIEAPVLPAATIPVQAYVDMFRGCTSLTKAPLISAEKAESEWGTTSCIYSNCDNMFRGCKNLRYIRFITYLGRSCHDNWVEGVAGTGTFVTKQGAKWPAGKDGVPGGWTIIYE